MPPTPLLLAIVALVPGVVTWWSGTQLLRRVDDPALPDLLLKQKSRVGALWALAVGAIVATDSRQASWAIPLMLGAMIAARYPARRVLLDERWSIGAYLWHSLRRLVGTLAFWVVLALTPSIILGTGDPRAAACVAVVMVAALLVWQHHFRGFWLWLHGATPLAPLPAELESRFAAVIAKATAEPPALLRFGEPGERGAAAYAFPSAGRRGAVVFSDALLELLTPAETTAVFAHEMAHLEHYSPARMRSLRLRFTVLIVLIAALSLAGQRWAPGAARWIALAGGLAALVALVVRASRSKAHETESDLRGAELCGDSEALVSALTKLHVALRLPQRWPADVERTATHPSLVHRIAALRGASAAAPADAPADAPAAGDGAADGAARSSARLATIVLGALALLHGAAVLWIVRTTSVASATPLLHTLAAILVGLSAAMALRPDAGRSRWLAAPLAALAVALPFAPRAAASASGGAEAALVWSSRPAELVTSAPIESMARDLALSPSGRRFVVRDVQAWAANEETADDEAPDDAIPERSRLMLGMLDTRDVSPRTIAGIAAGFVSDSSLLVLAARADSGRGRRVSLLLPLELRLAAVAGGPTPTLGPVTWRLSLPALLFPTFRVSAATGRWTVTGTVAGRERAVVMLEGRVGDGTYTTRRWPAREDGVGGRAFTSLVPTAPGAALAVRLRGDYRSAFVLSLLGVTPWVSELVRVDTAGTRPLASVPGFVHCSPAAGGGNAACSSTDAQGRAGVILVRGDGRVETLAVALAGPLGDPAVSADGRVVVPMAGRPELIVLDPAQGRAVRLALPEGVDRAAEVRWGANGEIVLLGDGERGTTTVMAVR